MKQFYLATLAIIGFIPSFSQHEYADAWRQAVNYDGVTHWSRYMNTAPGYMGPNALPVPFTGEGSIDTISHFSISATKHTMKGDHTSNLTFYFNYAIARDLVSFDLYMVPVEWFSMSDEVKLERRVVPHHYNSTKAIGDLHGQVNFQILNKLRDKIHLMARLGVRFPTSNMLGAARFTDMPGYFIDVNAGKPLKGGWKVFGNAGFYVWETIDRKINRQDDALMFGAGISYHRKNFHFQSAVSGYLGYMEHTLDKPIVARMCVTRNWDRFRSFMRLQQGIHQFKYTSVELGAGYVFKWKMKTLKAS